MISVVIPVYNGEHFIQQMYRQLCKAADMLPPEAGGVELVFVNDGSTDLSGELLAKLSEKDDRVQPVTKPNGGIADARNTGLSKARGEYICFVDQDDFVKQDMLLVLYEDITAGQADFVQAAANNIRGDYDSLISEDKDAEGAHGGNESEACTERSAKYIASDDAMYPQYLQTLVMRGLVDYPDCSISGSVWCCMFRTEFLRENNISFYSFCDYEDDWIFLTLALIHAKRFGIEKKTVYTWYIHAGSESHNRKEKDRYLEDFYEKHRLLRAFFGEALKNADLDEAAEERFGCELQKQALLWSLSNETGRGIEQRPAAESVAVLKGVVKKEKEDGIYRRINHFPLYISVAGSHGMKRRYYSFRDKLLTFLLLHGQVRLAVVLNRRFLHGRWHA